MTNAERLLQIALELGALKYGEFTLSAGGKSNYYFDGRLLSLDPEGAYLIGKTLLPILRDAGAQAVGGPAIGAIPIASSVSLASYVDGPAIPAFIVRTEAKGHGTQRQVEGHLPPGSRVAILDDTCTTGGSLLRSIEAVEEAGCSVVKVVSIMDRREGGSDEIRRRGYDFSALLEATTEGEVRVVK